MKIGIRELREGSNPIRFTISERDLQGIVVDMDELYAARRAGEVDLDLQMYGELMHLHGRVDADISFACARCLASRDRELRIPIKWTLIPRKGQENELLSKEEIELQQDDLDTSFYEGDEIDLSDLAREALLLELEAIPRCAEHEDCDPGPSLRNSENTADREVDSEDPRWAPLKQVLANKSSQ